MMTREQKVAHLKWAFDIGCNYYGYNPGHRGCDHQWYARWVGSELKRMAKSPTKPTMISREDALALAAELERGEYDQEFAEWFKLPEANTQ